MEQNTASTVESIENIEAGDVLVVERKGEVVADRVEVTEIETCGFSGAAEPQTDAELDGWRDLHSLLAEALGSNSTLAHNFEVYVIDNPDESGAVDEGEERDAVVCDGEVIAVGDELRGADDDVVSVESVRASNDNGHIIPTISYGRDGREQTTLTSLVFEKFGGEINRV